MLATLKRRWIWVAAVAATVAVAGVAAADRLARPAKMPGVCAKEIVPFCADPSWPDAG
ncbi:MAG: hypothetical protein U1E59_06875 [Amaricoccus sp.]